MQCTASCLRVFPSLLSSPQLILVNTFFKRAHQVFKQRFCTITDIIINTVIVVVMENQFSCVSGKKDTFPFDSPVRGQTPGWWFLPPAEVKSKLPLSPAGADRQYRVAQLSPVISSSSPDALAAPPESPRISAHPDKHFAPCNVWGKLSPLRAMNYEMYVFHNHLNSHISKEWLRPPRAKLEEFSP